MKTKNESINLTKNTFSTREFSQQGKQKILYAYVYKQTKECVRHKQ